jgi:hypothetical protein
MITITLTQKEYEYILDRLKHSGHKDLYNKLWTIKVANRGKLNGLS